MCGIAGLVNFSTAPDRARLGPMLDLIIHRGPDDSGRLDRGAFSVGMRRLSIIDLAGGHQPISNEDETVWVVFNGEIYNYIELREDLKSRGHVFRTSSDTEVLVHLYEEHGPSFLQQLNGMFGLAICDLRNSRILLARDCMGEKPLLYIHDPRCGLVFASELKCLLSALPGGLDLDRQAIAQFLHLGYVSGSATPFRQVRRLPSASFLMWEKGREPRIERYWALEDYFSKSREMSEQHAAEGAVDLLRDAVKLRLRSDVPVGTFLSGGIDSSAVTVLANRELPRIDTFSVGFKGHYFDETPYARMVAEQAGTHHHELILDPVGMLDKFQELVWHLDMPNWDPAMFPSYIICQYARKHVKVALSGNGGDELFAGYLRHFEPPPETSPAGRFRKYVPSGVRSGLARILSAVGGAAGRRVGSRLAADNNTIGMCYWADQADSGILGSVAPWARELFSATEWVGGIMKRSGAGDWVNRRLYYDSTAYLPDQILDMIDRSSMAVSLEVRVPFLDKRLVEYMAGVPGPMKIRNGRGKHLLQLGLKGVLPDEIFTRRKLGFGLPVRNWILEAPLKRLVMGLPSGALASDGILDGRGLAGYVLKDETIVQHCAFLWTLMMLESWYRQFVKGEGRPSLIRSPS